MVKPRRSPSSATFGTPAASWPSRPFRGGEGAEVDEIIGWLTGFSPEEFERQLAQKSDFQTFFDEAPALHPARADIKGVVCGVRVENIAEPLMREIRYLDKLVDELAKGKAMEKILRG